MPLINSVILADDDIDDIEIFKEAISSIDDNIKIEVVKNGKELMSLLAHMLPDLLFLDLEMPQKNGLECLVEIRGNEKLQEIPTIVFSSTTRQSNIQTAYEMGGHLFLVKSPVYSELTAAIKAVVLLDWSDPKGIKNQYCINNRYAAFT